jgi:ABC-type dipeptide/oligopeptide/nickel transport system permease subunit
MMRNVDEPPRLAIFNWADRAMLFAALVFLSFFAVFWLSVFLVVGGAGEIHLWVYMGAQGLEKAILAIGIAWIVLRGIALVTRGSAYSPSRSLSDTSVRSVPVS